MIGNSVVNNPTRPHLLAARSSKRVMSYGIMVNNPLPNPVRVVVIDEKIIVDQVVISPYGHKRVLLGHPGKYDIYATVLNNQSSDSQELGAAGWTLIDHQDIDKAARSIIPTSRPTVGKQRAFLSETKEDIPVEQPVEIRSMADMLKELEEKEVKV